MEVREEYDRGDAGANQSTGGRPRRSIERKDYKEEEDDSLDGFNRDGNGDDKGGPNSDADYGNDSNSTTEKNQDDVAADADGNGDVPVEDLTIPKLREMCKTLNLKTGGQRRQLIQRIQNNGVSGGNDNDNNDSSDVCDYLYTYDHDGRRLWPDTENTRVEIEEFVHRMTVIGNDDNLKNLVRGAPWETAFPGKGSTVRSWYKNLRNRTIVTTVHQFILEHAQYCGLSVRQIGESVQRYNASCISHHGKTFPIPSQGSEALEALYKARHYSGYLLARAICGIRMYKSANGQPGRIAKKAMEILTSEYSLVEKGDGRWGSGLQYLQYCGVAVPDTMREKLPDVDQFLEDVSAEREHTYAAEERGSQLVVGLQRQMNEKALVDPNILEAVAKSGAPGYNAIIDILRIISPIEEGVLGKHDLSIDHNGQMAVWTKALNGGKTPSNSSYDDQTREHGTCFGFNWLFNKQMDSEELAAWGMDWTAFNNDLSGGRKAVVDEINGRCSLDLMRIDDHYKKDCRNSNSDQCDCKTWNRNLRDRLRLSAGNSALSGKSYGKDDLGAVSAHHPCEGNALRIVRASSSRAVLLDMKKEYDLSQMKISMKSHERVRETKKLAREDAVTVSVLESDHRFWHQKVENGAVDIGGHLYNVVDGVAVVDADVHQEFREIFDLCGAASDSGLVIKVRMANAKPISIVPLVFDTSKVSQQHQSVADALFKMSKAALDDFIGHLSIECPASLNETEAQVEISIDLVSNKILNRLCETNREADDSDNDASSVTQQSPSTLIEPTTAQIDSNDTNNPPSASTSTSIAPAPKHPSTITAEDGFVVLISEEGVPFQLERNIAIKLSTLIANAIKGESSDTGVISCRHIKTATLEICVTFCKRQQTHPLTVFESALESCDISTLVDSWCLGFLSSFDRNQFWHLMMAAKIMGIKPLFDLLCATFASAVNGKTPDEVRRILDPEVDTPFVSFKTDGSCYEYKWELSKSGGARSENLGKSTMRKTNVSARREVSQEGSLSRSTGEDVRDGDDGNSGFDGGETDLTTVLSHATGSAPSASSCNNGAPNEINVDEIGLSRSGDASLTNGESQLIDDEVELMEGDESTFIVHIDDESVERDNSSDVKENAIPLSTHSVGKKRLVHQISSNNEMDYELYVAEQQEARKKRVFVLSNGGCLIYLEPTQRPSLIERRGSSVRPTYRYRAPTQRPSLVDRRMPFVSPKH